VNIQQLQPAVFGHQLASQFKIGRIGQPPGSKVYYGSAHCKCDTRDALFMEYGVACGHRLACVDIGQSPLWHVDIGWHVWI